MASRAKILGLLVTATFSFAISSQGQGMPDFSGRWELNLSKSKLAKSARVSYEKLLVKEDGPSVEFDYDSDGKHSVEAYVTDKKEKVLREVPAAGSAIVAKAYRKGASLVIETRVVFKTSSPLGASEMMHTKDSWTLSDNGLVLTDKYASDDGSAWKVYDKRN